MSHRILLVEDDHALRDVLRRGFAEEGFVPVLAADGATALRLAATGIAAVVLDVGLPDADGRDVCQAMRAHGLDAPVIFLTARGHLTTGSRASPRAGTTTCANPSTCANSSPAQTPC